MTHSTPQVDLSASEPITKWSEQWWANAKPQVQARRCTGHRKNGDRCKQAAMEGQRVCGTHGGRAPQAKRKARQRLEEAADRMARELLKIATDDNTPEAVRVNAVKDALDRAGVSARTAVDVSVSTKPFEQIFEAMEVETVRRSDYRRSQGIEVEPELIPSDTPTALAALGEADDSEILDVEIEDEAQPITPDDAENGSAFDSAAQPSPFETSAPGTALMTMDDAVAAQAAMRRQHAISRRGQRR